MILAELKEFVQKNQVVSIANLVGHFDMDPASLREMLEVWIRKGKIRKIAIDQCGGAGSSCQKCPQCNINSFELYEWIGDPEGENESTD